MHREKGYFRNGRKKGARSNLHNFRKKHLNVVGPEPEPDPDPVAPIVKEEKPKAEVKKVEAKKPVAKKTAKKNG